MTTVTFGAVYCRQQTSETLEGFVEAKNMLFAKTVVARQIKPGMILLRIDTVFLMVS